MSTLKNQESSEPSTSESGVFVIREATAGDRLAVGDLYKRSWIDLVVNLRLSEADSLEEIPLALDATWVVTRGDEILGFLLKSEDKVSKLYVAPEAQGIGVGSLLLKRAMAEGARRLYVDEINHRARSFYESHGWRPTGDHVIGLVFPVKVLEYEYLPPSVE